MLAEEEVAVAADKCDAGTTPFLRLLQYYHKILDIKR